MNTKDYNRIKVVLVEKKHTSKWLEEQLGKDHSTGSKCCANTAQPGLEMFFQIAKCFGVEVKDLIREDINNN